MELKAVESEICYDCRIGVLKMKEFLGDLSSNNFWLALAVAIIALLQWRTSEKQRKQDLFEIRFKFYQRLKDVYFSLYRKKEAGGNPYLESEDLFPLLSEARFLFGEDVAQAISDMQGLEPDDIDFAFGKLPDDIEKVFEKYMKVK